MALLEQWRSIAYDESVGKDKLQRLWASYFQEEKEKQVRFQLTACDGEGVIRTILEETDLADCERQGWSYLEVRQTVRQIMNVLQDYAVRECSRRKPSISRM